MSKVILDSIKPMIDAENIRVKDSRVILLTGKYKHRLAEISHVNIGYREKTKTYEFMYCCYVLRADGGGEVLNSDGMSRMYHYSDMIDFV